MGSIQNIITGKEAYKKLNTVSESASALSAFRTIYIGSVKAVRAKSEKLEEEVKKIASTYLPSKANPMIEDLRKAFKSEVQAVQDRLTEKLDSILQAKEEACRKYVSVPPSSDQLALLQALQIRGVKNISDTEWNMLIETLSGNYQCASALESMCKEAGRDFVAPFTPAAGLADIRNFRTRAETAIEHIADAQNNYYALEFLAEDNKETYISELIEKLDSEIATTIPSGDLTLKNRLKKARDNALHVGDYETYTEISEFIMKNLNFLESQQEKEQSLTVTAENLIKKGMNAQEKRMG